MNHLDQQEQRHAFLKQIGTIVIIIALLVLALLVGIQKAHAQPPGKHLPQKITVVFSDAQLTSLAAKIDSVTAMLSIHSDLPASFIYQFNQRLLQSFYPITHQVQGQLIDDKAVVPDTVKKKSKTNNH